VNRIKIAHITTVDTSLRYLMFYQLISLRRAGYEVVGISAPGSDVSWIEAHGIRHIPVAMSRNVTPAADLVALCQLYRVMCRERFTIVHTHTPKPGLLGQLAARMAGVPIVVNTLHGFYFHNYTSAAWRRFYISMEKIAARCSDVILSQSREDIQTALQEGVCSAEKIKYLGNGINLQQFDRERLGLETLEEKRRELGLPSDVAVVGFVGRLVAEKGILELMAAAGMVRQRLPDVRFLVVGPVDHAKADALSPDIARAYGVADICVFTGLRQDMPELYALMDVFVLPSRREGLPRAPMEASSMGVPCVVTDVRGCREVVEDNRNGLRVPLDDISSLTDAIVELLINRDRARQMGDEGRVLARERFDERLVFEKVKTEYARLLSAKGWSPPETNLVPAESAVL